MNSQIVTNRKFYARSAHNIVLSLYPSPTLKTAVPLAIAMGEYTYQ